MLEFLKASVAGFLQNLACVAGAPLERGREKNRGRARPKPNLLVDTSLLRSVGYPESARCETNSWSIFYVDKLESSLA